MEPESKKQAESMGEDSKIVGHHLCRKAGFCSSTSEAQQLQVSAWKLKKWRGLTAMASVVVSGRDCLRMVRHVVADVCARGGRAICFVEKYKADEAQFKLSVTDREQVGGQTSASKAIVACKPGLEAITKQAAKTRVLQSLRSYIALYQDEAGAYINISWESIVPLQIMSACQMDVYFRCFFMNKVPTDEVVALFDHHYQLVVTDGDGVVASCMRGVRQVKPKGPLWHHTCDIHGLQNMIGDVMHPAAIQFHIDSLIHMALSLQAANTMKEFRDAMRMVISHRLNFRQAHPRRANLQRNAEILRKLIPGSSRTETLRRAVIAKLLNGNWESSLVEHFCIGRECCRSKDDAVEKLTSILVAAVFVVPPKAFPKSRWTGGLEAVAWALLLLMMHNVLHMTYIVWASTKQGGKKLDVTGLLQDDRVGVGGHAEGTAGPDPMLLDDDAVAPPGGKLPEKAAEPSSDHGQSGLLAGIESDKQREQSRHRHSALTWLCKSDPSGMLFIIHTVMAPLSACMDR